MLRLAISMWPWPVLSTGTRAKRREGGARNGSLTIIVLTPLTTILPAQPRAQRIRRHVFGFVGVFSAVMSGPATGRRERVRILHAFLPCLALIALQITDAGAQTLTSDLLRPVRDGFVSPLDLPTRKTGANTAQATPDDRSNSDNRLRSGCTGALADRQYSDLRPARRQRRLVVRLRLAQPQTAEGETFSGAAEAQGDRSRQSSAHCTWARSKAAAAEIAAAAVGDREQAAAPAGDGRHRAGPAIPQAPQDR